MAETLLTIDSLRVLFGRFVAVDDVSFALRAGDLLGMIGPNGAGKTTTLRAAAGLQPISTGRVELLGHDVFRNATVAGRHVGFTPDTPQVYEALTVEQFLTFIGRCYDLPAPLLRERIDFWLTELWLTEKKQAKISALSRGMRQRLAVARTLLTDPHVILLDEPAAGLDPAGRVQFRRLLANLRDQGRAIIISSHILADLAEYCTHIAIMGHGRLLKYGTVAQVAAEEGDAAERCRYRVLLSERIGDLSLRLADLKDIRILSHDADELLLESDRGRGPAADLLRQLIGLGLHVSAFHEVQADLEQAYLRVGIRQVD